MLLHVPTEGPVFVLPEEWPHQFLGLFVWCSQGLTLPSLAILRWRALQQVPRVVLQEPVPSSSQSCQCGSSTFQPLKTRHIHRLSVRLDPQVMHPHVPFPKEVRDLPRLVVLDEGFVLAQVDMIQRLRDLGNAQELTLHMADLPHYPSTLSLIRSANHRPLASCGDGVSSCASEDFTKLQGCTRLQHGIHNIMFSGSAFASAPLSTTTEIFTIPFLSRSSAAQPCIHCL